MATKSRRYRAPGTQIREMTETHLSCRVFDHCWMPAKDEGLRLKKYIGRPGVVRKITACIRGCGAVRTEVWSVRTGDVVASCITYADKGYLLEKGTGRQRRKAFRKAVLEL